MRKKTSCLNDINGFKALTTHTLMYTLKRSEESLPLDKLVVMSLITTTTYA